MKIGSVVPQKSIKVTSEELLNIKTRFETAVKQNFNISHELDITVINDNQCATVYIENILPVGEYRVLSNYLNFHVGDVIRMTNKISITLFSEMCYDEAEVGPCYKWKDMSRPAGWLPELNKHSYSLYMNIFGTRRDYKHRTWYGLELRDHYQYGTELSDLDIETFVQNIAHLLKILKRK